MRLHLASVALGTGERTIRPPARQRKGAAARTSVQSG